MNDLEMIEADPVRAMIQVWNFPNVQLRDVLRSAKAAVSTQEAATFHVETGDVAGELRAQVERLIADCAESARERDDALEAVTRLSACVDQLEEEKTHLQALSMALDRRVRLLTSAITRRRIAP